MQHRRAIVMGALLAGMLGCQGPQSETAPTRKGDSESPTNGETTPEETPEPSNAVIAPMLSREEALRKFRDEELASLPAAAVRDYMSRLAPTLVGRILSEDELSQIQDNAGLAVRPMLEAWIVEPGFADFARRLIEKKLHTSGQKDGINYDLPGNTAAHIVREDLPWSEILVHDTCRDREGMAIDCDTGAHYTAGVLTTRAYMIGNQSRFNLMRAGTMLEVFSCMHYPIRDEIEPRIEPTRLIEMFRVTDQAQDVTGGFGNGFACYTCHGQFSYHAQLFVKYDDNGMYVRPAKGQQDPKGELGRSFLGLYASHMIDDNEAASEKSQYFGQPVDNLRGAAEVVASHEAFWGCQLRNMIAFGLQLNSNQAGDLEQDSLDEILAFAQDKKPEPSLGLMAVEAFSHPSIVMILAAHQAAGGE